MEHEFSEIKIDDNAVFTCRIVDSGMDNNGWDMFADERMWDYISDGEGDVLPQYRGLDEAIYFYTSLDNLQNMSDEELRSLVY